MTTPRCPTCRAPVGPAIEPRHLPFCSARCRLVDLGRWLDGDHRIPGPPAELDPADLARAMREAGDA